jgi:hypothetical protein
MEKALENLKKAEYMYLDMNVTSKSYWLAHIRVIMANLG